MPSCKSLADGDIQSLASKTLPEAGLELSIPDVQRCDDSISIHTDKEDADASDGMQKFKAVIAQANMKRAAQLATRIRFQGTKDAHSQSGALRRFHQLRFSCRVMLAATHHGSYNVLFTIRFLDGVRWLLRIPANGTLEKWDEDSAQALTSEVLTMKLIRNNSSIPVPRIFGFSATTANELRCPYILMERIGGINLFHGWFYNFSSPIIDQDSLRERVVANVARVIVKLNTFTFPKAGALHYNHTARAFEIGPYRKVDHWADPANGIRYSQQGPFENPKDYFLTSLDQKDLTNILHTRQGQYKLLRLFIEWFFQATSLSEDLSGFVLTHPDFALQNIIVGKDGSLRGFVDWDGVVAVPRCIGCEEYPLWLTSDWDPTYWNYDPEHDRILDDPVMLPAELKHYRDLYAKSVDSAWREYNSQAASSSLYTDGQPLRGDQRPSSKTRVSCLARCLYISANEPRTLGQNIDMLLEKITSLTAGESFDDDPPDNYDAAINSGSQALGATEGVPSVREPVFFEAEYQFEQHKLHVDVEEGCSTFALPGDTPILPALSGDSLSAFDHVDLSRIAAASDIERFGGWTLPDTASLACVPDDLYYHNTTIEHWLSNRSPWVSMVLVLILSIPAFFILLMGWLNLQGVTPLAIALVGLTFPTSGVLANLAALLLSGLLSARMLNQRFAQASAKAVDCSANFQINTPSHTNVLQVSEGGHDRTPESQILAPLEESRELTVHDEHLADRLKAAISTRLESSVETLDINDILHESFKNGEVCLNSALMFTQDDSDASDDSSEKSGDTNITVPSLYGNSDRGGHAVHRRQYLGPRGEDLLEMAFDERYERIKQIRKEDPTWDFGLFGDRDIYNALYRGSLDAARMRRLKVGFQRLLASLDNRFASFDGITLSDD
ncbi:MAG: hypothetical protein LQ346_006717 [Caloplaca aetnensis]|nr:MAG: hypothetical protein LQ346_006717 [Caloplaca aetnensis]